MPKKSNIIIALIALILIVVIFFVLSGTKKSDNEQKSTSTPIMKKTYQTAPAMSIDLAKKYFAVLETDKGNITVELFADKTPTTANNFIFLSREGFYDGTVFHRTVENFMIQGGDPKGDGTGDPGYRFNDEPFVGDYERGIVAMANAGKNTNGSQFFIMHQKVSLPKDYVIFGKVVSGIEVVDEIAQAPVRPNAFGEMSVPVNPVVLKSVKIEEK